MPIILGGDKWWKIARAIPISLLICFIVYQYVEYFYIRWQVEHLCKTQAGIFVYVTPEQWQEENKGQLDHLYQYSNLDYRDGEKWEESKRKKAQIERMHEKFVYEQVEYKYPSVYNERIVQYRRVERINYFVDKITKLLVDIKTNKVLVKAVYFNSGVGGFMSINRLSDMKGWMNTIPDCYYLAFESVDVSSQFSNPSLKKGMQNDK